MKTSIIFLIGLFLGNIIYAQETNSSYFAIKNYFSIKIEKEDISFSGVNDVCFVLDSAQHFDIQIIKPAINFFTKKGHFHELGITELQLLKTETVTNYQFGDAFGNFSGSFGEGTDTKEKFGLRYQFNYALLKKRVTFFIGAGVEGYYQKEGFIPEYDSERERYSRLEYYTTTKGLVIQVIPRVIFPINNKVFLDFNMAFSPYKIERTDRDRWQSTTNQNFINFNHTYTKVLPLDFEFAIGIGYKFGG